MSLVKIQADLKAPKSQYNSFGKYKYRNVEDIQEALKPLLLEHNATLILSDELVLIGERYYIKATALLKVGNEVIQTTGYAREELDKKGMDSSQITGACSSYARKYALNAMFLIDDTKDSDATNKHGKEALDVIGDERRLYLQTLLENTTYDDDTKDKLSSKIDTIITEEAYNNAYNNLMSNQIEDKDRIAMGLNYNQSDIKKTQKASKK